jgi:hypothetical protein
VFLDFDGVLNSSRFARENPTTGTWGLDPSAVRIVSEICERGAAEVVISSSWRIGRSLGQLKDALLEVGFRGTVRGATPLPEEMCNEQLATLFEEKGFHASPQEIRKIVVGYTRGREIDAWLKACPWDIESFVILDDDSDTEPHVGRHVKTTLAEGILSEHVEEALRILETPLKGDWLGDEP